jgi:hypothetical protein
VRRFDVELLIVHPTFDPAEISAALSLEPRIAHGVGKERMTASGRSLEGVYSDTRWRHSVRYEVRDQWFADKVGEYVDRLAGSSEFLRRLRATGGKASVIVQFLGDGYFGDEINRKTLKKLIDLELDLAIECFQVAQS